MRLTKITLVKILCPVIALIWAIVVLFLIIFTSADEGKTFLKEAPPKTETGHILFSITNPFQSQSGILAVGGPCGCDTSVLVNGKIISSKGGVVITTDPPQTIPDRTIFSK